MSLKSFNSANDEQVKKNLEETINNTNIKDTGLISKLHISQKPKEKKGAFTYSILASQNDKLEKMARERGFKNKSEFLSAIIDAL